MNLTDARKARIRLRKKFPVGRGESSGLGKTSGRGTKGQWARSGTSFRPYFEGGQMSIIRRLPKRGFNNKEFKTKFELVHLDDLAKHFEAGATVDEASLRAKGFLRRHRLLKLLGDGAIDRKLTIKVHAASESAKAKVAKAGGTLEIVPVPADVIRAARDERNGKNVKKKKPETKPAQAQSKPKAKPEPDKK